MGPDLTLIEAIFDDDSETWWIDTPLEPSDPDEAHDDHRFAAYAPTDLVARWRAADDLERHLRAELVALADVADDGRRTSACDVWRGYESPGHSWSAIMIPPSGSPDVWPVGDRPVQIETLPDHAMAQAVIDQLPETFLYAVHRGLGPVLRRDQLTIVDHSMPGYTQACGRCGWAREDHADPGTPAAR